MKTYRIRNVTKATTVADLAFFAGDSQDRRTGLLKHASFPEGEGLLIAPCECIHTFGMKFPIDVVFLSRKRKVLKISAELPSWRIAVSIFADTALELPAGTAARTGMSVGDELVFEKVESDVRLVD